MKKDIVDLLNALAAFFIEKINADITFQNRRIEEWCANMPVPPKAAGLAGANTDRITEIHEYLCQVDARHSARGYLWPGYVLKDFIAHCDVFEDLLGAPEVHPSVRNLLHYHLAIHARSSGEPRQAITQINSAIDILQSAITESKKRLPRYERNVILDTGCLSEFCWQHGDFESSVKYADEMLSKAVAYQSDDELNKYEVSANLPPIRAMAHYFCCQAYLAAAKSKGGAMSEAGNYIFAEAFGAASYRRWEIPMLVQILRNDVWSDLYPFYYERIADQIFRGTARSPVAKLVRQLSISAGRVRVRAPAVLAAAALVLFLQAIAPVPGGTPGIAPTEKPKIELILQEAVNELRELQPSLFSMSDGELNQALDELSSEAQRIQVKFGDNAAVLDDVISQAPNVDENARAQSLTVALVGNQQGVGPGIFQI